MKHLTDNSRRVLESGCADLAKLRSEIDLSVFKPLPPAAIPLTAGVRDGRRAAEGGESAPGPSMGKAKRLKGARTW